MTQIESRLRRAYLIPFAVAGLLGFSACWAADHGDADLKAKVETALRGDKHLLATHVDVSVKDGVVRLSGFVQDDAALRKAEKDASDVPGVKSVKNEISLKPENAGTNSG